MFYIALGFLFHVSQIGFPACCCEVAGGFVFNIPPLGDTNHYFLVLHTPHPRPIFTLSKTKHDETA